MSDDALQIIDRSVAYQGFFRIDRYRLRHRRYDGGWSGELSREILERGRAVGLLLYDPGRDAVVLIEQFRLPAHLAGFSAWQLEIVAGLVDHAHESEAEVALREAHEEAGVTVLGELVPVHRFLTSPGATTETVAIFCGRVDAGDAGGIHGLADEHEDIKVVVTSADDAIARARAGKIENAIALLALYWLAENRDALRQRWR
ncbi:MAG TPA: NUDIX domain-containing protein [Stellaceae bacterium]|nr:NUDIX domain-containing protein [Stellaceae bacterium]